MFDKIKQKIHGADSSANDNTTAQHANKSTPSIHEPSSETNTRHSSGSSTTTSDAAPAANRLSVSGDRGRTTGGSNTQSRTGSKSRSRSRARDVLWKNSLYDPEAGPQTHKEDANLRAKSLSVAQPHPTVVEERMKGMPYGDWTSKN